MQSNRILSLHKTVHPLREPKPRCIILTHTSSFPPAPIAEVTFKTKNSGDKIGTNIWQLLPFSRGTVQISVSEASIATPRVCPAADSDPPIIFPRYSHSLRTHLTCRKSRLIFCDRFRHDHSDRCCAIHPTRLPNDSPKAGHRTTFLGVQLKYSILMEEWRLGLFFLFIAHSPRENRSPDSHSCQIRQITDPRPIGHHGL
jgi:hypothetical protein